MKNGHKTTRIIFYSLGGLVGLCCVAWLTFSLKNNDSEIINPIPSITSNEDESSIIQNLDQTTQSLNPAETAASNKLDNIESEQCIERCSALLSILDEDLELEDEDFQDLERYLKEIAAYLQNDESKRLHYLKIALTTTDEDKRSFLTDVFKHLPYQQKIAIGADFIESENWRVRADGVSLIAGGEIVDPDIAHLLIDIFSTEKNSHIKGSILTSLEYSPNLQNDPTILRQLDDVINYEPDFSVRKAALNAKMSLSDQPHHILPDAIQALSTSNTEYQLAGLIAINQVLEQEQKHIENGAYIDKIAIKNTIESIMDVGSHHKTGESYSELLVEEAYNIHTRYF